MLSYTWATYALIVLNVLFSYKGLTNQSFFEAYLFEIDPILKARDYKRLITSGFLHVSWMHLFVNMLTLYFFGPMLELSVGSPSFLVIYFASLIGGDVFALFVHRNHGDYRSAGASGAVCGIIFASIMLFPGMSVGIFFLPISVPGWLYGLLYIGYTMYAIRAGRDNVGHAAHFGGALLGLFVALLMRPEMIAYNYLPVLLIAVPTIVFVWLLVKRPHILLIPINDYRRSDKHLHNVDTRYNAVQQAKQDEIDRILDKIGKKGMESLSKKEKELLELHSEGK